MSFIKKKGSFFVREFVWVKYGPYKRNGLCLIVSKYGWNMAPIRERVFVWAWVCMSEVALMKEGVFV